MLLEQRGHLFAGTLAEDLRLVAPDADADADEDRLRAALALVGLDLDHAAFPAESAVDRVFVGRTSIVVAHRLSQAVAADRFVLMADGRIRATGTHTELLRTGTAYAALWEAWTDQPEV